MTETAKPTGLYLYGLGLEFSGQQRGGGSGTGAALFQCIGLNGTGLDSRRHRPAPADVETEALGKAVFIKF